MTVYWYIGHYRRDYYSADRYEDGFTATFYSIVASVIVLGATVVTHFVGARLRLMRLLKKLLLVSAVLGSFLLTVDWYFGPYHADYYFLVYHPDAPAAMAYAIVVSEIILVATVVAHFAGPWRPRK